MSMKRYFFHLRDFSGSLCEDGEGAEFASLAAAKEYAFVSVQELVADAIKGRRDAVVEAIIIADEHGTHLAAVPVVTSLPNAIVGILRNPDKVVPQDRLGEYRRNADDCCQKAESASDPADKMSWLKLADAWLQMLPASPAGNDNAGWPKPSEEHSKSSH